MKQDRKIDGIIVERRQDLLSKPWQVEARGRRTSEVYLVDKKSELPATLKAIMARLRD